MDHTLLVILSSNYAQITTLCDTIILSQNTGNDPRKRFLRAAGE